jgi:hypothetical protein
MTDISPQEVVNPAAGFPFLFVDAMVDSLKAFLPSHQVVPRSLRMTDSAMEIGHPEAVENRYTIRVTVMRKSMDEAVGRAQFANDAKLVRVILYRDPDLRVRLAGLQESLLGTVEQVQRYRVTRQEYNDSELAGSFVFVANLDFVIETTITAR